MQFKKSSSNIIRCLPFQRLSIEILDRDMGGSTGELSEELVDVGEAKEGLENEL